MHPTVDRGLAHKHPDDRDEVADTLTAVVTTGAAFSSRHHIITTTGATRHVLVVGDQLHDQHGLVVGTSGYYIDLTDAVAADRRHTVTTELPELLATRAAIEQAKGALMAVYGVTAEQAFAVLEWRSQETNTKLRTLAERLVDALTDFGGAAAQTRTRFDHLLLTAHRLPPRPR